MAIGSGLGGSLAVGVETPGSYGVYATPAKFPEVNKSELKKVKTTVQGGGLAAGRGAQLASRRVQIMEAATGSVDLEVTNKGFGLWLSHIFGSSTIAQQAASTAYLQTHTVGDNIGKSLTLQNAVPDNGGVIRPYTLKGGKITKLSISCTTTGLAMATVEIDGQKVSEVETLVAPSFTTAATAFHGGQLSVRTGTFGAEVAAGGVKGFTLDIERGQNVARDYASTTGAPLLKAEPIWNDYFKVSGTIDTDLVNKADFVDRFASDTPTSVVLEFLGATIATTYRETMRFTLPATFFEDGTPTLQGPEIVGVSIPFTAQLDLTNGQAKAEYMSTDVTVAA